MKKNKYMVQLWYDDSYLTTIEVEATHINRAEEKAIKEVSGMIYAGDMHKLKEQS